MPRSSLREAALVRYYRRYVIDAIDADATAMLPLFSLLPHAYALTISLITLLLLLAPYRPSLCEVIPAMLIIATRYD